MNVLEEYKIERLVLVPTLLRSLLMFLSLQDEQLLYNLRIWVCSGEPLSLQLAKEFFDYFEEGTHQLCNFYGSTEVRKFNQSRVGLFNKEIMTIFNIKHPSLAFNDNY